MHRGSTSLVIAFVVHLSAQVTPVQTAPVAHDNPGGDNNRILVDLSYDFSEETIVWPTLKKFEITSRFEGVDVDGIWKTAQSFCSPEHAGTHIDAPVHFRKGAWSVDEIPVDNLVAHAVKVDISAKVDGGDVDAQLTTENLLNWEAKHGLIPNRSVVFMYSGWGKRWPNATAYYGSDLTNMTPPFTNMHFPGIHPEAAKWLIENRTIVGVGVDSASTDYGQTRDFMTHQILSGHNVYGLENVKNLDQLPTSGATVYIAPMKIRGGTGAPCRIIGDIRQQMPQAAAGGSNSSRDHITGSLFGCILFTAVTVLLIGNS